MGMVVRSNIMAYNANRQLGMNNNAVAKSLEKLSSGFRINRAGDDASGLAISEKMKAQIKGLETASANSQDGISLVQTAEGALTEVHSMLNRMVELATKAANGTMDNDVDRASLQKEVDALKAEINRIAEGTNFNGINLLDGTMGKYLGATAGGTVVGADGISVTGGKLADTETVKVDVANGANVATLNEVAGIAAGDLSAAGITLNTVSDIATGTTRFTFSIDKDVATQANAEKFANLTIEVKTSGAAAAGETATFTVTANAEGKIGGGLSLQVGDTADAYNKVTVAVGDMSAKGLAIDAIDISSQDGAAAAIKTIKDAINTVSSNRADLGAVQNRLEYTINNLDVAAENMSAANSRIRDTDMAKEMMNYTKMNVLTQAAQAMLAQANQQPQSVLQLLQ